MRDYAIVQLFRDEDISGGLIDRPGMQTMLAFLKKHKRHRQHVVIIDDISRWARALGPPAFFSPAFPPQIALSGAFIASG